MLFEYDKKKVTLNENYFITFETKLAELQNEYGHTASTPEYGRIAYAHSEHNANININNPHTQPLTENHNALNINANDIIKVIEHKSITNNKKAEFLEIINALLYEKQNPNDICGNLDKTIQILKQSEQENTTIKPNNPTNQSSLQLNKQRGTKVKFLRVINCLFELSFFKDKDDNDISKKEVFEIFGKLLNQDFSTFHNDLSSTKAAANSDMNNTLAIFKQMLDKQVDINDK